MNSAGYVVGWLWVLLMVNGVAGTVVHHNPVGALAAVGAYAFWVALAFVQVSSKWPFWVAVRFGLAWPLVLWPGEGSGKLHRRITWRDSGA